MRSLIVCFLVLAMFGCTTSPTKNSNGVAVVDPESVRLTQQSTFHVQIEWKDSLGFQGYQDTTASTDAYGGVLYDGGAGIAGVLAQVAIHAAVSDAVQESKEKSAKAEANLVLSNYEDIIETINQHTFTDQLRADNSGAEFNFVFESEGQVYDPNDVVVVFSPTFYLSPDQKGLMLMMDMKVGLRGQPDKPIAVQTIKSISTSILSADPVSIWRAGEPCLMQTSAKKLFSRSAFTLLEDLISETSSEEGTQNTYKYMFGDSKRYERASLIKRDSDLMYLRNLRGHIVTIPDGGI